MDGFCHQASPKRPSVIGTPNVKVRGGSSIAVMAQRSLCKNSRSPGRSTQDWGWSSVGEVLA